MCKVALLCPGVGRVNRGYERFARELFTALKERTDIVFWKGAGEDQENEIAAGGWARDGWMCTALGSLWKDRFFWEGASFGIKVWPKCLYDNVGIIHYSEPVLNSVFSRLERFSKRPIRRLFSHALNMDPEHTLRCHHIHQVSPIAFQRARELGVPEDRMTLLPYGLYTDQFVPVTADEKRQLRAVYGVPRDAQVVLSVAALNRHHKQIDRLVSAFSGLPQNCHLVLCGKVEDQSILDEAKQLIGGRFSHLYVPAENVREIYQLADLFVLPSIIEGFGLVVLEAALSGLPVLVHDSPHFRWMLGPRWERFVDMRDDKAMSQSLADSLEDADVLARLMGDLRGDLVMRYDWSKLESDYRKMYSGMQEGPTLTVAQEMRLLD